MNLSLLRNRLKEYKDIFFTAYMVILGALVSMGFSSSDKGYKICFALCILLWLLNMSVTDFTLKEFVWTFVIFALLGLTFITNREKTLIITAMGISGVKNCDLGKMFKCAFFVKLVVSLQLLLMSFAGFICDEPYINIKGGRLTANFGMGFIEPNRAFNNLLTLIFLFLLAYGQKLKWYWMVILSGIAAGGYLAFGSRTGALIWLLFLLATVVYALVRKTALRQYYLYCFAAIPVIMTALTFVLAAMFNKNNALALKINSVLHNRVYLVASKPLEGLNLFGASSRQWFDNGYYHIVYNYGYLLAIICLVAYVMTSILLTRQKKDLEVMILGATAAYIFMEYATISVNWSFVLVYISLCLFKEKRNEEPVKDSDEGLKKAKGKPAFIAGIVVASIFVLLLGAFRVQAEDKRFDTNWETYAADSYEGGSGSKEDPYLIKTAGQLAFLAKEVNSGVDTSKTYYKLTKNINIVENEWVPIGYLNSFKGHFDGNGHLISGLVIRYRKNVENYGLFGINEGRIVNLRMKPSYIMLNLKYAKKKNYAVDRLSVGTIAGVNRGTVKKCIIKKSYIALAGIDEIEVGKDCGRNEEGTIKKVVAKGDIVFK